MRKNGKKSLKIAKNGQKLPKMPKNGKKSQKMVKNCPKCSKNAQKCFFFEMLRKSSKMPIKSAIFQKIKQTKINSHILQKIVFSAFSARPTESSTLGKNRRTDAPSEARGAVLICGDNDAKARAQDRGGGVSGSRNKIRQKTARTPCRPRSTAWIWGVRGEHAKKSSNQIRQMNIFFGCTPARPCPSTTIL